jgi:hypothetical protein
VSQAAPVGHSTVGMGGRLQSVVRADSITLVESDFRRANVSYEKRSIYEVKLVAWVEGRQVY